ncbi:hypothetical protein AAFG07_34580 [Bradyrhizobium sp. B097]|uniref:hypothetical protein n=1 Tax=Bradyrhizobium sp. B097 TaxID=3140244 RepID=UPI003183C812
MPMDMEAYLKLAGVGLTVAGLFFTGYQIREANRTLVFTTEQGVYKESRDILKFLADNPSALVSAQADDISNLDAKDRAKLSSQIGVLLNFYNSMLVDRNSEYVSAEFRRSLIADFCILVRLPQISKRLPDKSDGPFQTLARIRRSDCHA